MKRCPRCGCTEFCVFAHVVQEWKIDQHGNYVETTDDCLEITHYPDDNDIWDCVECLYSDRGSAFNVKEENQ